MKPGLILDLDGVICDTAHFHYLAWSELASEFGITLTETHNEALKGVSRTDSLLYILSINQVTLSEEEFQSALIRKNSRYLEFVQKMGPQDLLPGVAYFFQEAKSRKLPLALGSASKNAELVLEKVGLSHAFHAIVDANTVLKGKPDPETFLMASELLGIPPTQCWVFEDSAAGIQAALTGNMRAIGIGTPETLPGAEKHIPNLGAFQFDWLQ
jgi:beta-phosphoglucomutase